MGSLCEVWERVWGSPRSVQDPSLVWGMGLVWGLTGCGRLGCQESYESQVMTTAPFLLQLSCPCRQVLTALNDVPNAQQFVAAICTKARINMNDLEGVHREQELWGCALPIFCALRPDTLGLTCA
eukprot:508487-Pelagomonas_calceolata.AAC.1